MIPPEDLTGLDPIEGVPDPAPHVLHEVLRAGRVRRLRRRALVAFPFAAASVAAIALLAAAGTGAHNGGTSRLQVASPTPSATAQPCVTPSTARTAGSLETPVNRVTAATAAGLVAATVSACDSPSSAPPPQLTSPATESSGGSTGAPPASVTAPPTTRATVTASASRSTGAQACVTNDLKISLGQGQGAARREYLPLLFTNDTHDVTCSITGYPGVSFADGGANQIGAVATRVARPSGRPTGAVVLAPGQVASVQITFPSSGVPGCDPQQAELLIVYVPGQRDYRKVPFPGQVCSSTKEGPTVSPIVAGTDPR